MTSYTHAGVSRLNGAFKVRFANDMTRVKVLAKNGHKDIDIVELRHAMNKEEAIAYLLSINFDNGNVEVRSALETAAEKRNPEVKEPVKRGRKPKSTVEAAAEIAEEEAAAAEEQVPGGIEEAAEEAAPFDLEAELADAESITAMVATATNRGKGGRFAKKTQAAAETE